MFSEYIQVHTPNSILYVDFMTQNFNIGFQI